MFVKIVETFEKICSNFIHTSPFLSVFSIIGTCSLSSFIGCSVTVVCMCAFWLFFSLDIIVQYGRFIN